MSLTKPLLSFFFFLYTISSLAQTPGIKKYHPLSGRVGFSLEAGPTLTLSDFSSSDLNFFGRFTGEYLFPSTQIGVWGLKGHAAAGFLEGSGGATVTRPDVEAFKTTFFSLGGGGEYLLRLSGVVMPYVYTGAAYLYFDPRDLNGDPLQRNQQKKYSKHEWSLVGEGGFKFLVSDNVSLNVGFNINYINMDNLDDVVIGTDNDIFFNAFGGITIFFSGTKDSDGDGVADDDDLCPITPNGVIVDQFGCPVDKDKDGVPDYQDLCSNTPANILVNIDGCPVDSDNDGVPDFLDLCKDTPESIQVDKRGCPLDEDGDGVPDYKDKCLGTPSGIEVNWLGCPLEEFTKELPEVTSMTLSSGVNFEVGKANLLPGAKTELNKMITVMIKNPDTRWQIIGYTDNTGSYSMNVKLSYERAYSVANYLVQNGVEESRLDFRGLGPDNPIADNSSESGRALNRRVEITYFVESSHPAEIINKSEYNIEYERNLGNMIFTDGNLYCFQVSSYRSRSRAESDAQRFRAMGEKAYLVEANLPE
ncbi:MAG: OmpA family protein, partial [Ignavibacteriaceae bacterium]